MGVVGHYIADLHNPLHTIINYNGQFTGNDGVHKKINPVGNIEDVEDPWSFSMKIV